MAQCNAPKKVREDSASVARFCLTMVVSTSIGSGRFDPASVRWKCGPTGLRLSGLERVNCRPTREHHEPVRRTLLSSTTALSRRIHSARHGRVLLNLAVVPVLGLVLAFSACGSSSSNSSDTPSSSPTTRSQASNTKAECSSQAILSALPGGATMQEFTCAKVGDAEWAAARVSPGDTFSCSGTAPNGTPRTPRASAGPHRRDWPSRSCPTASSPGERMVLRQRPIRSAPRSPTNAHVLRPPLEPADALAEV